MFRPPLYRLLEADPAANYSDLYFVRVFSKYKLENLLGNNERSMVFRAVRIADQTECVLKIYNPNFYTSNWRVRRRREAIILLSRRWLRSVRGRSTGISDALSYLEMEYFDGSPLDSMMPARVYSELTLLKITEEIILAVQEIHDAQVVHGDIKPDNILLSAQGSVKFVDFELSRMMADERSMDKEELVGSMGYLAPEIILHEMSNSFLSDIFSTGMTLYFLWTGFHGCLAKSTESFIDRLQTFNPKMNLQSHGVHPRISDLICAMVDPNPHYRPHSLDQATVLVHDLHDSLRNSLAMTMSSHRWTNHSPRHHLLNSVP